MPFDSILTVSIVASLTLAALAMWLRPSRLAGRLDTWAWLAYLVHVAIALVAVHGSHAAAYDHTARRTAELFGSDTGVGLYVNYLFTLWWSIEVGREVRGGFTVGGDYDVRKRLPFDVFLWFMTLNGAVIFARGAVQIWGIVIVALMTAALWRCRRRMSPTCPQSSAK